jgi:hypothetical protein
MVFQTDYNAEADQSSPPVENDRPPTYTPTHTGHDSVAGDKTKSPSTVSTGAANHSKRPSSPISIFRTDGPGLSPNKPIAIVQLPIVLVKRPIPNGRYLIKNRAEGIYWYKSPNRTMVTFWSLSDTHVQNWRYKAWCGQVNEHSLIIQVFKE